VFHLHSDNTKGVHPMTYDAIARAQDAISMARDVQNSETQDKVANEDVRALSSLAQCTPAADAGCWARGLSELVLQARDQVEDAAGDMDSSMTASRTALWKTIGQLRNKIKSYRDKLLKMKADMMASDNYIAAREDAVENSVSRAKVSGERMASNMKAKMENIATMTGPPGAAGQPGHDGNPGALGAPGELGEPGRQGAQGETGPRGWDGRDGQFGQVGPKGDAGLPGARGPAGNPGQYGLRGPIGAMGNPGESLQGGRGGAGPEGPPGYPGVTGPSGDAGMSAAGPTGPAGAAGAPGAAGPAGPPGSAGPGGVPGQVFARLG
jgi:hypothetical protein